MIRSSTSRRPSIASRAGRAVILATLLGLSTAGSSQVLDLDDAPPFPSPRISVLDELAAAVVLDLPPADATTDTGIIESAGATLRRLIAELAMRGRGDGDGDAIAALVAIRLADSVDGIERRLERLATPGAFTGSPPLRIEDAARRRALDRLAAFERSALEVFRRRPTESSEAFDAVISIVLAPIVDALEIMERRPLLDRWPEVVVVRTGGVSAIPASLPALPTRPGLEDVDRRLRAGGEDEDRLLHRRFRSAAAGAAALDPEATATTTVLATMDALVTDEGSVLRRRIEVLELAVAIATDLESIAVGPARRDADTEALAGLLESTLAKPLDEGTILLLGRQASTTALVVNGAVVDVDAIDRDLRTAARAIQQRHRRIVRSAIAAMLAVGDDPSALGDPDTVGALQALEGSIRDLDRLRTADRLASRLTAIRPGAVREFRQRIREWCRMLGRDATQAEGAAAIDTLVSDLDRFVPLPAESWLAAGGPVVVERTGGRGRDLLDRMTETRRRWADEVFHGELAGPARADLVRLARLGELLMAMDAVLAERDGELDDGLDRCDRWGGWFVAAERLSWTTRQLAPSLRLAVIAAVEGDETRLERDLDRLSEQAPPAMVIAWLASRVGPPLAEATSGSIGAIAASALPPDRRAWGLEHRAELARICRGFAEIEAARGRGDEESAVELTSWVVAACDDLLDRVRMSERLGRGRGR